MKIRLVLCTILLSALSLAQTGPPHSNTITWSWTPNPANDPATSFTVQRAAPNSTNNGPGTFATIASVAATIFTYVDSSVTAGQTWYYQCLATNPMGSTPASNIMSALTPFSTVPAPAPSNLQVVAK